MPESDKRPPNDRDLNPALRRRTEETYDTTHSSLRPIDSASVQRQEGRAWPMIWLIVFILSAVIAIYLIFF